LRGFLSQDKEVATQRAGGTQGGTDAELRQKDHKRQTVFGLINYIWAG